MEINVKYSLRQKIEIMQDILQTYEDYHSLFINMSEKIITSEMQIRQYGIKNILLNFNRSKLKIEMFGKIVSIKFSLILSEQINEILGKLKIYDLSDKKHIILHKLYFNRMSIFNDNECNEQISDINNRYFPERFFYVIAYNLLKYLGFERRLWETDGMP